jgi:NitT/TauT family transport system ATP-binding protein
MSVPRLRIQGVDKTFHAKHGSVEALRGIDLDVDEGEFVSLVGASGSGKSTLLRIIDGLIQPSAGQVLVDGQAVSEPGPDRAVVFQQDSLLPWKSVIDNVAYGLRMAGMPKRRAHDQVRELLAVTGLRGFENHFPHQLSGGMRQRANVVRALAVDPSILLLDEPFAALDAQTREIMQAELLKIWSAQQKTVVFITHQIDEAVYLSDRVVVFSARPGTVRDVIDVPLPRPRDLTIKRSPEFVAIVDRIWAQIEHEVRQSMGLV